MHTLNRQRANTVFSTLVETDVVLTPEQVAQQERIFERDGVLRWRASNVLGYCKIGISLKILLHSLGQSNFSSGSFSGIQSQLAELMQLYQRESYVLWYDRKQNQAHIILKEGASPSARLKAWSHALVTVKEANGAKPHDDGRENDEAIMTQEKALPGNTSTTQFHQTMHLLRKTLMAHSTRFDGYAQRLKAAGWDLDTAVLETRPGYRFAFLED